MNHANAPVPVILVAESSVGAFHIFNPNDWQGETPQVIQSCATELSALQHSADQIALLCLAGKRICLSHFGNICRQWRTSPWDLSATVVYGQVPDIHVLIQGYFASLKSLLDLSAQLLCTEGIVAVALHAFHRVKGIYGGGVLNALENNARAGKQMAASAIRDLFLKHKALWIDEAVKSRDNMIHPIRGAQQLMFQLQVERLEGSLVYKDALPPHIGIARIDHYTAAQLQNFQEFARALLQCLHQAS